MELENLKKSELTLLFYLYEKPPHTYSELLKSQGLGQSKRTVTMGLKSLESLGLFHKVQIEKRKCILLTEQGRNAVQKLRQSKKTADYFENRALFTQHVKAHKEQLQKLINADLPQSPIFLNEIAFLVIKFESYSMQEQLFKGNLNYFMAFWFILHDINYYTPDEMGDKHKFLKRYSIAEIDFDFHEAHLREELQIYEIQDHRGRVWYVNNRFLQKVENNIFSFVDSVIPHAQSMEDREWDFSANLLDLTSSILENLKLPLDFNLYININKLVLSKFHEINTTNPWMQMLKVKQIDPAELTTDLASRLRNELLIRLLFLSKSTNKVAFALSDISEELGKVGIYADIEHLVRIYPDLVQLGKRGNPETLNIIGISNSTNQTEKNQPRAAEALTRADLLELYEITEIQYRKTLFTWGQRKSPRKAQEFQEMREKYVDILSTIRLLLNNQSIGVQGIIAQIGERPIWYCEEMILAWSQKLTAIQENLNHAIQKIADDIDLGENEQYPIDLVKIFGFLLRIHDKLIEELEKKQKVDP